MRTSWFFGALLSTIALLPLPALAQPSSQGPFDPIDTRIISDPFFLPLKGQVYGATVFTLNSPNGDNFKAGVQTGSFHSSNSLIDQTFAVGVARDVTIRAAMGYASNHRDSTAMATGDVTSGNSSGFNDPTFSATLRLLEQLRSPAILDLTASYSPNLIDATSSAGERWKRRARGSAAASLALGSEMKAFTIAATATARMSGGKRRAAVERRQRVRRALELTRPQQRSRATPTACPSTPAWDMASRELRRRECPDRAIRARPGPDSRSFNAPINWHLVPRTVWWGDHA